MQTPPDHAPQRTRMVAFGWNPRVPPALAVGVIVLLCMLVWAAAVLNDRNRNSWSGVKRLKDQVTRNADPTELRQWAATLLATHGRYLGGYQDVYGTNMPVGLRKVKAGYPNVMIWAEKNQVSVFGDRKGAPFLVIAPSSTTHPPTNQNFLPWQPGIYFVR